MSCTQWQQKSPHLYWLSGELTRETIPALWAHLNTWKPKGYEVEISMEQVNRVDSAGMVMLLHLIERAKTDSCHIILSFVPEQMHTLFQLSNIEGMMSEHIKTTNISKE
ncbi:NTP-binding protein [Vibrio albus]|jgi:phospholipid transport system transporter-binding protein|uniref:NTP-binding protein n=1 Tax=Vibrio albus TaxID=2200953 RepID=A0A2U3B9U4_9VIBR|nr:lipid asymmetry maintenance protein MlaB [Vibrio albus]PWI33505.1 NTP-binding protein [Vibrio albus]